MTRKFSRNYSLSVVASFIAILILVIAATVLAQTTGAGQTTGQTKAVLAPAGTPAQAERPLPPWTGAGSSPVSRSQTKRHGARPMDGNPLFLPVVTYDSGGFGAQSVAVGDLNGDGNQDAVVVNGYSSFVSVMLGNGDGTFQPGVLYWTGGLTGGVGDPAEPGIAIMDLNGDGKPDLLVSNPCGYYNCAISPTEEGTVGVLLGNGDGTFQPAVTYGTGGVGAAGIAVADVNGDGKPDLLVINPCGPGWCPYNYPTEGTVGVLLGNGDGTFQPAVTYPSGGIGSVWAAGIAVADLIGNGKPDVVVANNCFYCGGSVTVLLGNGDGTFQPAVSYDSGGQPNAVAVADVNGDGKPDLVVANTGNVAVLLGNGDGTFQPAVTYGAGGSGLWVGVADVNGDGKPDLVLANSGSTTVSVLLGNGDGTFQTAVSYGAGGTNAMWAAVADVNGDGRPDVLVADLCPSRGCGSYEFDGLLGVLLNAGNGNIPTTTSLTSSPNPSAFGQVVNFQASVTSGSGTPIGIVTFLNGSVALGSANLVDGSAAFSTSSLPGGSDLITASYRGYKDFSASTSNVVTQIVNPAATATSLPTSSLNPSIFGQMVTFAAQVSSGAGTPTGTVIFYDGSAALGSATLTNGIASFPISSLAVGSHSITAAYQGSGSFIASTSPPLNQVVTPATTTTSLVSSLNPAGLRKLVTYTATVNSQFGGAATGTVTFQDGGTTVATVGVANNQAAYGATYKKGGSHAITATYSGDASNLGSTPATLMEYIESVASKTVVTTSGSPSHVGQPVTFTATVTSKHGAIPDGELVTFYNGKAAIGTGATASGMATFTTSSLKVGKHTINATYAGDDTFEPSTGSVKQVVEKQ